MFERIEEMCDADPGSQKQEEDGGGICFVLKSSQGDVTKQHDEPICAEGNGEEHHILVFLQELGWPENV